VAKEFKLIVAGGRDFNDVELLDVSIRQVVAELPDDYVVSIVSGMAKGADKLGHQWAKENQCKVYEYYADWRAEPRRAGYLRNEAMAKVASGLLAFHDSISKGTAHMIHTARAKDLYVKVIKY
jgi:hypothetical protein